MRGLVAGLVGAAVTAWLVASPAQADYQTFVPIPLSSFVRTLGTTTALTTVGTDNGTSTSVHQVWAFNASEKSRITGVVVGPGDAQTGQTPMSVRLSYTGVDANASNLVVRFLFNAVKVCPDVGSDPLVLVGTFGQNVVPTNTLKTTSFQVSALAPLFGCHIRVIIGRDGAVPGDTYAGDFRVYNVAVEYQSDDEKEYASCANTDGTVGLVLQDYDVNGDTDLNDQFDQVMDKDGDTIVTTRDCNIWWVWSQQDGWHVRADRVNGGGGGQVCADFNGDTTPDDPIETGDCAGMTPEQATEAVALLGTMNQFLWIVAGFGVGSFVAALAALLRRR